MIAPVRDAGAADELLVLSGPGLRIERLGDVSIDILFNNAGLYGGSWDDSSAHQSREGMHYDLWERIMRVNVVAPFRLTHALLPNLGLGARKLVVMMSSDLGSIACLSIEQSGSQHVDQRPVY